MKYRYERWGAAINGCMGSIRTTRENYYVASVYPAGYLKFEGIEACTRGIDENEVKQWARRAGVF